MNHSGNANKMVSDTPRTDAVARINEYLGVGGLFNPEILNVQQHEAVRDTLIQARDELNAANDRIQSLIEERDRANRLADWKWNLRDEFQLLLGTDKIEEGIEAVKELKRRIQRLEEAGDYIVEENDIYIIGKEVWQKAKEAKP